MMSSPRRRLYVSDLHVGCVSRNWCSAAQRQRVRLGIDAVAQIIQQEVRSLESLWIAGDLANGCTPNAEFHPEVAVRQLQPLSRVLRRHPGLPVYVQPRNNDPLRNPDLIKDARRRVARVLGMKIDPRVDPATGWLRMLFSDRDGEINFHLKQIMEHERQAGMLTTHGDVLELAENRDTQQAAALLHSALQKETDPTLLSALRVNEYRHMVQGYLYTLLASVLSVGPSAWQRRLDTFVETRMRSSYRALVQQAVSLLRQHGVMPPRLLVMGHSHACELREGDERCPAILNVGTLTGMFKAHESGAPQTLGTVEFGPDARAQRATLLHIERDGGLATQAELRIPSAPQVLAPSPNGAAVHAVPAPAR